MQLLTLLPLCIYAMPVDDDCKVVYVEANQSEPLSYGPLTPSNESVQSASVQPEIAQPGMAQTDSAQLKADSVEPSADTMAAQGSPSMQPDMPSAETQAPDGSTMNAQQPVESATPDQAQPAAPQSQVLAASVSSNQPEKPAVQVGQAPTPSTASQVVQAPAPLTAAQPENSTAEQPNPAGQPTEPGYGGGFLKGISANGLGDPQGSACEDIDLLGLNSFFSFAGSLEGKCTTQASKFLPMVWSTKSTQDVYDQVKAMPVKPPFVIGYNEPDYVFGPNDGNLISPEDAGKAWCAPEGMLRFLDLGVKLLSPSPINCSPTDPNCRDPTPRIEWLNKFFTACPQAKNGIGIAYHYYGASFGPMGEDLNSVIQAFPDLDIYITEVAFPETDAAGNVQALKEMLTYIDGQPKIQGLFWSNSHAPSGANLISGSALTELGNIYKGYAHK